MALSNTENKCTNEVTTTTSAVPSVANESWFSKQWGYLKEVWNRDKNALEVRKQAFWDQLAKVLHTTVALKQMCNQVFSLFSGSSIIILFPRMDFKGMGYVPQLFFIYPKRNLLTTALSVNTTDRPIISYQTRKMEYASYNIDTKPMTFALSGASLSGPYKKIIDAFKFFEPNIKEIFEGAFGNDSSLGGFNINTLLQNDINLIRYQLLERVQSGVYFSVFSPAIGFHETAVITGLNTGNTPNLYTIDVNITVKIVKTFNLPEFQDYKIENFYQA